MTTKPLEDVEYLVRSNHRVEVLRTLADGPYLRPDLYEETEIPQPTLGRILGGFEDRHWVEREGRAYALTALGALVVQGLEEMLDTVATVQRLGEAVQKLPTDELDFDLRELADATVTTPEVGGVFAPVDRLTEQFCEAEHARILVHSAPPGTQADHHNRGERFEESDREVESINSAEALDQARTNPETAAMVRASIESGRAHVYETDDDIPFVLAVADGVTMLAPMDDRGIPTALIETDNETARAWAEATLDSYRDRARRVTPEDLET